MNLNLSEVGQEVYDILGCLVLKSYGEEICAGKLYIVSGLLINRKQISGVEWQRITGVFTKYGLQISEISIVNNSTFYVRLFDGVEECEAP